MAFSAYVAAVKVRALTMCESSSDVGESVRVVARGVDRSIENVMSG